MCKDCKRANSYNDKYILALNVILFAFCKMDGGYWTIRDTCLFSGHLWLLIARRPMQSASVDFVSWTLDYSQAGKKIFQTMTKSAFSKRWLKETAAFTS